MSYNEDEFRRKLIQELHDIALSLKEISGRNVVDNRSERKPKTYAEKYFARTKDE